MKKDLKVFGKVMAAVAIGSMMLNMTACDLQSIMDILKNPAPVKHTHTMTATEAKAATCMEEGNIAYWTCEDCEKIYSDEQGENEITAEDTVLAAKGHAMKQTAEKAATCTEEGNTAYWTCEACGKVFADKDGKAEVELTQTVLAAMGHELKKVESTDATCTESGNVEYWACDRCNQLFADAEGTTPKTASEVAIAPNGHTMTKTEGIAATCTEDGTKEYWTCEICGKVYADEKGARETTVDAMVIAAAHTLTHYTAVAPTWAADGHIAYEHCTVCDKYFADETCEMEYTAEELVIAREAQPTDGLELDQTKIKGTTSFWKVVPESEGKTSLNNGWYVFSKPGEYEGEIGLPELKQTEERNDYLEFVKASRFELFWVLNEEKNAYAHLGDSKGPWKEDAQAWLYDKTFVYDFDVTATGKFSFEVLGMSGTNPASNGKSCMTLTFEGNTITYKTSSLSVGTLAEGFDFADGQHHHIAISINRYGMDTSIVKVYVDGYKVIFIRSENDPNKNPNIYPIEDGSILNKNASGFGQRFSVIPEKAEGAETFSTVCIHGLTISRFGGEQAETETPTETPEEV